MKKGFTMIELIFVIVILGILASVAIPRLAATRTDAEIATTVSNIRTLISDLSSYYVVKGEFGNAKWGDVTNVPVRKGNTQLVDGNAPVVTTKEWNGVYYLSAGGINCIAFRVKDSNSTVPAAYIEIIKTKGQQDKGICPDIINAEPIKAYLDSNVSGITPIEEGGAGVITFGSSISIYPEATTTPAPAPSPAP